MTPGFVKIVVLAAVLGCGLPWLQVASAKSAAAATPTPATSSEVFAGGLIRPRGLAFAPDGTMYVAEAGTGGPQVIDVASQKPHAFGRTGRLSRITLDGRRTTVVDGLPSTIASFNEELGPSGLAFMDGQLYLLTASGGWEMGDPEFHSGVFRVSPEGNLERIFDYSAYTRDHPTISRLEDSRADVPLGMAFGLASLNGVLYTTDGNQEQILAITPTGEATRIVEYPRSNRALTGITAGPDGALYVAEHAAMKITRVGPDGDIREVATKLNAPISVSFDQAGKLYALEYYLGRVVRTAPVGQGPHELVASGLIAPTAMAFGPDGNLYIATGGSTVGGKGEREGQIVRLRLAPSAPAEAPMPVSFLGPGVVGLATFILALLVALGVRHRLSAGRPPERSPDRADRL